ncbi:MAG TPA: hypothetical protein VN726_04050 [Hanamia sp.]|nr:hypothetical protein [Hanamia sp.]
MKMKEDKNIENLVEKMMSDSSLETPSFDFTSKVMSEVLATEKKHVYYNPLISKRGWFVIFTTIAGLLGWLIFNSHSQTQTNSNFDFSFINADKVLKVFSGLEFSGITANIILFSMMMMFVQIILLKGYLNKRFHK